MLEYGNNEPLLRQIATATGGHFNPAAKAVFDTAGRGIRSTMDLWPGQVSLGHPDESGGAGVASGRGCWNRCIYGRRRRRRKSETALRRVLDFDDKSLAQRR